MGIDGEAPAPEDGKPSGAVQRASALRAIGTVVAIALVAAGGFVVFARSQATVEPPSGGLNEEVPSALADGREPGTVPDQIAAAVEAPVLAVVRLDELSGGLEDCAAHGGFSQEPELEAALVTPDGATVSLIGEVPADFQGGFGGPMPMPGPAPPPPPPLPSEVPPPDVVEPGPVPEPPPPVPDQSGTQLFRLTCSAQPSDGGWHVSVSSQGPADQIFEGSSGTSCCDAEGNATASTSLRVPEGTAWLVQDRGGYRLAYPVDGLEVLPLTWHFREGPFGGGFSGTPVTLLDADGDILEERFVGV